MPRHLIDGSTTSDPGLAFDTWRHPSTTQPCLVFLEVTNDPTGLTASVIHFDVDEASTVGAESADYTMEARAPAGLGGTLQHERTLYIPPGGAYQIRNTTDPDTANAISVHRELLL